MQKLLTEIRDCTLCTDQLPLGPNPVLSAQNDSKIILVGQAPGIAVHESSKAWADKSGKNLRDWLGVNESEFYDTTNFAIIPMGFCYPGRGKSGDLPPMKICAPTWHTQLLSKLNEVKLILLIGKYAQDYYLPKSKKTLTLTVQNFNNYLPKFFPLPHPSPRNNIWMAKNPWFKSDVIPNLQYIVSKIIETSRHK